MNGIARFRKLLILIILFTLTLSYLSCFAKAANITPPLANDPSLVLRLSFDVVPSQLLYDYTTDWLDGWTCFSNYGSCQGGNVVTLESAGTNDVVGIQKNFIADGKIAIEFDLVEKTASAFYLEVIEDGTTKFKKQFEEVGHHRVELSVNGSFTVKFYLRDSLPDTFAKLDNVIVGTIVEDSSGNNNDGYVFGATRTTGRYGYALQFDGEDDYVEIPYSDSLNASNYDVITIAVWANRKGTQSGGGFGFRTWIVSWGHVDGGGGIGLALDGTSYVNTLRYEIVTINGRNIINSPVNIPYNEWHFYVVTYKTSGEYSIWVDGNLIESGTVPYPGPIKQDPDYINWHIGKIDVWGEYFNGIIDEVRIYNRALSDEEIKSMYERLRVKFYDETNNNKIKANLTVYNQSVTIDVPVDDVTKEGVLFWNQIGNGTYILRASATDYPERYRIVNISGYSEVNFYLCPSSEAVLNEITIIDYSNKFYSSTTHVWLVKDNSKIVDDRYINLEHKVMLLFQSGAFYTVYISNGEDTRALGFIQADPSGYMTIYITPLEFPSVQYASVSFNITNDNGTIIVQWHTLKGTTSAVQVIVNNSTSTVFIANATTGDGKTVFYGDPNETYKVSFIAQNSFENVSFSTMTGILMPAITFTQPYAGKIEVVTVQQLPAWMRIIFFGGLCVFVALLFKRSHTPIGLSLALALAATFTYMKILPLTQNLLWILAFLVALSYFLYYKKR